jgi:hypothetical protein
VDQDKVLSGVLVCNPVWGWSLKRHLRLPRPSQRHCRGECSIGFRRSDQGSRPDKSILRFRILWLPDDFASIYSREQSLNLLESSIRR